MLSYSARRYDSAVCCSKMSCDTFLIEVLYEADKALDKFAVGVCVFTRWRMKQMYVLFCYFA